MAVFNGITRNGTITTKVKINGHTFIWKYTRESRLEALRSLWRFASDPELEFTWRDAMRVAKEMRKATKS